MNEKQRAMYEARARIVKALAHPARLMMVDELAKQPLCVCDIRELVGSDLSTVSKHLSILKNAGIVEDEKRGSQVFYSLRCPCAVNFFSCAEKVLKTTAKDQMRLVSRK
ncbi:MAG: metalloregulator ArsR/SmtB family transcription factor [bacterium]